MKSKLAAVMAASLVLLAGCGGPPAKKMVTVTGVVKYKGEPLKTGVVKFLASNGDFAAATITPDGKFTMSEVVPGDQKVAYVGGPMGVGSSSSSLDKNKPAAKVAAPVPAKFGDPQTSGVTVNVSESGGEVTVELK